MSAGWPRASRWLLTGGAGYIGSHIVRELRAQGCQVVVLDDLSTGVAARIPSNVPLVVADVRDQETVGRVLRRHAVEGVIHLAARKSVAESLVDPLAYWHINVEGTRSVMQAAVESGVRVVIFSSSSSVYGEAGTPTVAEDCPLVPINPYGQTKVAGEQLVAAAARRLAEEVGLTGIDLTEVGAFTYRADDPASGRVEHEYDHVLLGIIEPEAYRPRADPSEVAALRWIEPSTLWDGLNDHPDQYAPWLPGVTRLALP